MEQNNTYRASVSGVGKNIILAYLFWFFLGWVGAHRFYLDRPFTAVVMIVLFVLGIPTFLLLWIPLSIWWLIDGYIVYMLVTRANAAAGVSSFEVSLKTSANADTLSHSNLDALAKLHDLKTRGVLSEAEFEAQKARVLGTGGATSQ